MALNNFLVFNEAFKEIDTMNDTEYQSASQRQKGVASGIADRRLHNKFYRQASIMVKTLAKFIESQGEDATDEDESVLLDSMKSAFTAFISTLLESHDGDANAHAKIRQLINNAISTASSGLSSHNASNSAHSDKFAEYLKLSTGGIVAGPTTFNSAVTLKSTSTVPTQPTSSNNTNLANTAFVKAALLAFLSDRAFIKAVMDAIGSETLSQYGVKSNFDNPNAWSICFGRLFGGLIIQGGSADMPQNVSYVDKSYPINFTNKLLAVIVWDINATSGVTSTANLSISSDMSTSNLDKFRAITSSNVLGAFGWLAIGN